MRAKRHGSTVKIAAPAKARAPISMLFSTCVRTALLFISSFIATHAVNDHRIRRARHRGNVSDIEFDSCEILAGPRMEEK